MSAASAVAPTARKLPAPDQDPRAADAKKRPRPRYKDLMRMRIDEFEVLEVLGWAPRAS